MVAAVVRGSTRRGGEESRQLKRRARGKQHASPHAESKRRRRARKASELHKSRRQAPGESIGQAEEEETSSQRGEGQPTALTRQETDLAKENGATVGEEHQELRRLLRPIVARGRPSRTSSN